MSPSAFTLNTNESFKIYNNIKPLKRIPQLSSFASFHSTETEALGAFPTARQRLMYLSTEQRRALVRDRRRGGLVGSLTQWRARFIDS